MWGYVKAAWKVLWEHPKMQVDIQLDEPTDFVVNLYDLSQHLITSRKVTAQQTYQFTEHLNGKPGAYIFQFITPHEAYYRIIIVQ